MNPNKETGREYVYGNFGIDDNCKSYGWHGDIEAIIAEYESSSEGQSKIIKTCDKSR